MAKSNILFLVIDAFPAERCYGKNKTSKTPNIDSLIKRGVYFDQAISCADQTPAAFAGIFTALFPFKAGMRTSIWSSYKFQLLAVSYVKILKEYGYHAYATIPKLFSTKQIFPDFEKDEYSYFGYRLYNGLGKRIIEKLESKKMKEPWIYLIHLMDGHKPISYPKEFDGEEYGDDEYDRTISSIDLWIGKILKRIDLDKTLIILTSDHGDYIRSVKYGNKRISLEYKSLAGPAQNISKITPKFLRPLKARLFIVIRNLVTWIKLAKIGKKLTPYEKRILSSARTFANHYLFDEVIRIPLIFSGYGIPSVPVISQQIRTIDIFPTICELVGLNNREESVHGKSLLPIINGKQQKELPAYIETSLYTKDTSKGGYGIRTSEYKYFRRVPDSDKKIHLYDLKNDPLEENNIAESQPAMVQEMENMLGSIKNETLRENERDFIKRRVSQKRDRLILHE